MKAKQISNAKAIAGDEERNSPRFLRMRENDFEIEADFWREVMHVTSPALPKYLALGATLKSYSSTTKNPVVTIWLKSLEEINKELKTKMMHSIKAALNSRGYAVHFR